jgi:hypothetical protein
MRFQGYFTAFHVPFHAKNGVKKNLIFFEGYDCGAQAQDIVDTLCSTHR